MDIKEIALKIASELDFSGPIAISPLPDHLYIDFAEALIAELAKQNVPIAINEPNYHYEAMGCGLEDRGITDRYEAMEYGWNCAIERMFEQLPEDQLYTFPPTAEQIANETAEACARYVNRFLNGDGIQDEAWIRDIESGIRRGTWKEFKQS